MTAVTSTERLSPFSQLSQYCSSLSSILSTVFEKTDTAFRRVQVMKRDENGNFKSYQRTDPVTKAKCMDSRITYIEHISTGELYKDEPAQIVSIKCALIVLAMPFYTVGKMAWYLCKTPFDITTIVLDTLIKAGQQLVLGRFYAGFSEMGNGCIQLVDSVGSNLFEIVKGPIFGLGTALAALYGTVKPYHGRVFEALMEKAWQQGASYKDDFRNIPPRAGENCWEAFVKDVQLAHPFYLAHCFQSRGNINDPRIVRISPPA
jgi:hypothetical protein